MSQCKRCNKELTKGQGQFCSRTCRDESAKVKEVRQCKGCGKKFEVTPWERKTYCTSDCYHESRKGTTRPDLRKRHMKICPTCGNEFEVGGRANPEETVFCSRPCAMFGRYRRGNKCNELSAIDAAYIAGFFDGEGSIMILPRNRSITIRVTATNCVRSVLDWMVEITGIGAVANRKEYGNARASFFFVCNAEAALTLLQQIRPYLRIKTEQADLAIDAHQRLSNVAMKIDTTWQKEYVAKMKLLNQRGSTLFNSAGG
jgi:hypothetical protein